MPVSSSVSTAHLALQQDLQPRVQVDRRPPHMADVNIRRSDDSLAVGCDSQNASPGTTPNRHGHGRWSRGRRLCAGQGGHDVFVWRTAVRPLACPWDCVSIAGDAAADESLRGSLIAPRKTGAAARASGSAVACGDPRDSRHRLGVRRIRMTVTNRRRRRRDRLRPDLPLARVAALQVAANRPVHRSGSAQKPTRRRRGPAEAVERADALPRSERR
jgi:hypothetical protein